MARILTVLGTMAFSLQVHGAGLEKMFQNEKILVGAQTINAWIADDSTKREHGLMFVEKMPEDTGMLFIFENLQPLNFWMKNTLIPLAIGYFDDKGVLIDIQEMRVANSLMDLQPPTYESRGPALFALEMNTGWFTRHKIKVGAHLKLVGTSTSKLLTSKLGLNKTTRH